MKSLYLSFRRRFIVLVVAILILVAWLAVIFPQPFAEPPVAQRLYGAPTIEQSAYRFFENTDSTAVTSALAAQNTPVTLSTVGQAFRLRMLIHIGADTMPSWEPQAVESTGNIGQHTSIAALDAETAYVSYYDATNGDLKVAKTVNGGASWTFYTVDTSGDVGQYTGISAVDANTVFVSYYDASVGNLDLKVAYTTNGGTNWIVTIPDSTGNVGQYSAIDAHDANTIYVSYYDATNGDIKVAKTVNGGASWTVYTPESTNNVGQFTSIQTLDANTAYISYYDVTNGEARFAKTTDGGTGWTTSAVTSGGPSVDVGRYTSIAAADTNTIYVSMYHVTNQDLRVNKSTNGGSSWSGSNIDTTGNVGEYTSIEALDANTVYGVYYDATNGNLKLATTTNGGASFSLQTIETTNDIGQYAFLSLVSSTVLFASYYDATNGDLRVAPFIPAKMKLQYAQRGSDNVCDTNFVNETYADVTTGTPIAFYNNPSVADGDPLTSSLLDPSHSGHTRINQTYEEANPFSSSIAVIQSGQDGKWDFSLTDSGNMSGTIFCLRAVKNDGTLLDTYSVVPQVTTSTNVPPNTPTNLRQRRLDTLADIPTGGWITTTQLRLSADVTDPDAGQSTRLCVRILRLDGSLVRRQCGGYGTSVSKQVDITSSDIVEGPYQWEAQAEDQSGAQSAIQCFPSSGCNQSGSRDFGVDLTSPTSAGAVVRDGVGADIDTQTSTWSYSANWSGFTDASSGIARYDYQLKRDSDGVCWDTGSEIWGTCSWFSNGTSTTITLSKSGLLSVGQSYSLTVRAVDAVNFSSSSIASDGVTVITASAPPPPPPVLFSPPYSNTDSLPPPEGSPTTPSDLPPANPASALRAVTQTLQNLQQALQSSPIAQTVTNVAPIAAPATATTGILVVIAQFLAQGPVYISYLWTIILEYLGFRRRRRSWGTVYNAETKDPLPLIVVQLIDRQTGKVVEQRVTDQQGRFGFLPKRGTYRIQANHPGYQFPSKIEPGKGDFRFAEVYHGEDITIREEGTTITVNIPLDPVGIEVPGTARFSPKVSFRRVSTALLIVALLLQGFTAIVQPRTSNIILLIIYIAALVLWRLILYRRKPKNWAVVYDVDTKAEIAGAEIYITEEGNPRFGSRRVTDESGRAYLLLPPGRYHLFVNHPQYHFPIADETPGYKGEVIIVTKENPLIHIDIPLKREDSRPSFPLPTALVAPINRGTASEGMTPLSGGVSPSKLE